MGFFHSTWESTDSVCMEFFSSLCVQSQCGVQINYTVWFQIWSPNQKKAIREEKHTAKSQLRLNPEASWDHYFNQKVVEGNGNIFYQDKEHILQLLSQKYVLILMSLTDLMQLHYFSANIVSWVYCLYIFTLSCCLCLLFKEKPKIFQCHLRYVNSLSDLCMKWLGSSVTEIPDSEKSRFRKQDSLLLNLIFKIPWAVCKLRLILVLTLDFSLLQSTLKMQEDTGIINWFLWVVMKIILHKLVRAAFTG